MNGRTNSMKSRHRLPIVIILVLVVTLTQPLVMPVLSEYDNFTPIKNSVPSAENPSLNLTYYFPTNLTEADVVSDSIIDGDHVIIKAAWTPSIVNRSRLEIIAPAIPATLIQDLDTYVTELDTRSLGNNATCIINATAWLTNGSIFFQTFENVYIGNFFVPKIILTAPNGGEVWSGANNITWASLDTNKGETLRYTVLISSDSGETFKTLASSISQKWFEWDCTEWDMLDTYLVEVIVSDGIYFNSDRSDSTFTAGEVIITPTVTTTTTTTTTSTGTPTRTTLDPRLTAFIAILLISSSVMAIVVYYAARKWF